ncbi:MAG: hypothetical protein B7C24_06135 [Bacteroidetes bacterium 4572_77]|nr:MAG: hypothetical protein B7C24_06135 [Bacteroidetes bacterium 4572_77]
MSISSSTKYSKIDFLTLLLKKSTQKPKYLWLILCFLGVLISSPTAQAQNLLKKIVIDAGHGGKDPGAIGKNSKEKNIVLTIALKTGELLKKQYPEIEIIYTRKTDVFIPLKKRAQIANDAKADLFLSIHCNANKSSQPHGTETYVMGLHKSEANLNVAKKENAAILLEDDYQAQYDGFDPNTDESHIIFNFFQNSFLSHNLELASHLQNEFGRSTPLSNRGVKQAGFWVLYKTTMPGVLIETGFLSNAKDEKFLVSKSGQLKMSKAIAKAVSDYKLAHDALEKTKQSHLRTEKKGTSISANKPKKTASSNNSINTKKAIYKIQFLSLSSKKTLSGGKYDKIPPIDSYLYKELYRYTSGQTNNYEEAINLQAQVRKAGFKDAFVVAFYKGKRISLAKAKKMK